MVPVRLLLKCLYYLISCTAFALHCNFIHRKMKKGTISFGKIRLENVGIVRNSTAEIYETIQGGFGSFGKVDRPGSSHSSVDEDKTEKDCNANSGKKAREFDLEMLVEQTRQVAMERNKDNFAKDTDDLDRDTSSANEEEKKSSERNSNDAVEDAPLQPAMVPSSDSARAADDDFVGPPLPPEMLTVEAQEKNGDSDLSDSDNDDEFKLPVTYELNLNHGDRAVSAVAMDPAGSRLVSGSLNYDVKYWDFQGMDLSRDAFRSFCPHDGYPIQAVDYSCTGDKVVVASTSCQAKVYDRDGVELFECAKGDMYIQDLARTKGHVCALTGATWHPKNKEEFMTCSRDGTCRIWISSKPLCQQHVIKPRAASGLKAKPSACSYSRDGNIVACVNDDGSIQMWDHRRNYVNTIAHVRDAHTRGIDTTCISFSYDNKYYATRGMDETLKLWDVRNNKNAVYATTGLFNRFDMTSCLFSPNDQLVVTCTSQDKGETSGKLVMFNRNTWKLEYCASLGNSHLLGIVWHPRLNQLCLGCGDGSIIILYDPALSRNGAVLVAGKTRKRAKATGVVVSQQIITPHALPLFKEDRPKTIRKQELKDRKDPVRSRRPDLPLGNAGTGGRVTSGGSTLSSYIIRNMGLQNRKIEDDGDPREALLKYDKLAREDPYWVSPAYAKTQPKPIFREAEEEETLEQKAKRAKTS